MGVPWKVTSPVKERMAFVARLHAGERMADLCKEFGISRKTGYKFVARFERLSVVGLEDQSRAPVVRAKTPSEIEDLVVALRRKYPTWGPRKLLAALKKQHDG
ncbi:MAG TPA: helix-turn-helix domain-containing protein, partial [Kofleriaceae bacterium]|nr:helix-turn-helix domain-containing protein [Kofleriaceae bacterium]